MNILFVSESIWMEGVVYDLHILAEGLLLLGHKVYAIDPGEQSEKQHDSDLPCESQKGSRIYSLEEVLKKVLGKKLRRKLDVFS